METRVVGQTRNDELWIEARRMGKVEPCARRRRPCGRRMLERSDGIGSRRLLKLDDDVHYLHSGDHDRDNNFVGR